MKGAVVGPLVFMALVLRFFLLRKVCRGKARTSYLAKYQNHPNKNLSSRVSSLDGEFTGLS